MAKNDSSQGGPIILHFILGFESSSSHADESGVRAELNGTLKVERREEKGLRSTGEANRHAGNSTRMAQARRDPPVLIPFALPRVEEEV
jgi:hypothetical protein